MPSSHPLPPSCRGFSRPASALDPRSAARRAWLLVGAVLGRRRRAVTSGIRAAGLSREYRPCDTTAAAVGTKTDLTAAHLAHEVVKPRVAGAGRLTFAIDDTPTERHGRHVQGAGVHHNPTPGPAGGPFVYGHVWVVRAPPAAHPAWGVVALPRLARVYVRQKNPPGIAPADRPAFRTERALAAEWMRWAKCGVGMRGTPLWAATDGAYATAPFLKPMTALAATAVGRLRKDANLRTVPDVQPGKRGRPRTYGERRIDPAKRGGQRRGWATGTFAPYGEATEKTYETFVATWRPAGGALRVVLAEEPDGWVAFFCTDTAAAAADIRGCVANRFPSGMAFRDCKDIVGAGRRQVRRVRASVGACRVCVWTFATTEAWAWGRDTDGLVGHRAASPWDDGARRPRHADERRAWRRELLAAEVRAVLRPGLTEPEVQAAAERLPDLAA